jgi:hypothetical protein
MKQLARHINLMQDSWSLYKPQIKRAKPITWQSLVLFFFFFGLLLLLLLLLLFNFPSPILHLKTCQDGPLSISLPYISYPPSTYNSLCIPFSVMYLPQVSANAKYILQVSVNAKYILQVSVNAKYILQVSANAKYILRVSVNAKYILQVSANAKYILQVSAIQQHIYLSFTKDA